jgi:hypothetical protein
MPDDSRVPVVFAPAASEPGDALLIEGEAAAPAGRLVAHFRLSGGVPWAGCPCCAPRGPISRALLGLFVARARGVCEPFTRVVVLASAAGEAAVRQAVADDAFLAGRYRLVAGTPRER